MQFITITSAQNTQLKQIRALQQRRHRYRQQLYVAEGPHLLAEAVQFDICPRRIVADNAFHDSPEGQALFRGATHWPVDVYVVPNRIFRGLSATQTPQGVLLVFPLPPVPPTPVVDARPLLVLDALQDPGNMGTILRTALATDVSEVIIGPGCTDPFGPKAVRAGMGAQLRLPLYLATSHKTALARLAGRVLWLAEAQLGVPCSNVDWQTPSTILIGNEARGLSSFWRKQSNHITHIPLANQVESLNAASAASIFLYEAVRQRAAQQPMR